MKTQRTITIELEQLTAFLKDKFQITAPLYAIKTTVVENTETRKPAVQLLWEENTERGGQWDR